jgi:hypothetical protein
LPRARWLAHDRLARFASFATSSSRIAATLPPAGTFRVGVEQPQIRNKMGHVVARIAAWLHETALRLFPDSPYAKEHGG